LQKDQTFYYPYVSAAYDLQIIKGEFKFPEGFPDGAQKLIKRILTTNPNLVRHAKKMRIYGHHILNLATV
jgi:hypothetical protein